MILVKFKFVKLTHRNRIPKIQPLARAVCVNHWDGVRVGALFSVSGRRGGRRRRDLVHYGVDVV